MSDDIDESVLTNDDLLDEDEDLGDSVDNEDVGDNASNLDDGLPSRDLANFQSKMTTREQVYSRLYGGEYRTTPLLTPYEKAKVLGVRAVQISQGAPTFVDIGDLRDPIEIARKELYAGKIPFLIDRPLPGKSLRNPKYETRRVSDLILRK